MTSLELVQYAADNQVGVLQLCDNLPLHRHSEKELDRLKEAASRLSVSLEVGTKGLFTEHILTYISMAQRLGAPFLRVVIDDKDFEPREEQVIETVKKLLPHLRQNKIILAIENHDRFPVAALARIINRTDPEWVRICLDTVNSLGAGESVREVVETLAPYTVNVHIKDFTVKRAIHKMGFRIEGASAGEGMLDIPWLLDVFRKISSCRSATLELWPPAAATVEMTLDNERAWVKRSLDHLKKIIP